MCEGPYLDKNLVELGCSEEDMRIHDLGVPVSDIPYKHQCWENAEPLRILIAANFDYR